jgi:glycosyltransferase involved in cell wall biosynthesis
MLFWGIRKPFPLLSLFFMVLNQEYQSYKIFWKNLWSVLAGCYFARIAKKERLDHLHAHFASYPALTAMAISKLSGIPFSFTCHAHDIFLDKTLLKEKARAAKNIIAISHYNKQYLESYCQNGIAEKTKVVHCGISLEEFKFLQQKNGAEKKLIVAIGRLSEMKGFENLIKACARIQWRVPFTCKIVGEGEQHKALQKLITDLKLNDRVFLSGYLDNYQTKELLNQADLFVLPSIWSNRDGQDGIPLVLMEAMAIGVPVISTKISGIPELIEDGKSGLLVEPANVDALAEKMIALLENRELATQLALKGREKVEREFDVVKSVEVLSGIFGALQMLDTGC